MTALTSTERSRRRNERLNAIAKTNGFETWQRLETAATNGQVFILTNERIYEILVSVRDGPIDMGDGLQGLVYAVLYDCAKHLGLSEEQAQRISEQQ